MPRVLVISDDGEMVWNERVNDSDFETEHFRRCLWIASSGRWLMLNPLGG